MTTGPRAIILSPLEDMGTTKVTNRIESDDSTTPLMILGLVIGVGIADALTKNSGNPMLLDAGIMMAISVTCGVIAGLVGTWLGISHDLYRQLRQLSPDPSSVTFRKARKLVGFVRPKKTVLSFGGEDGFSKKQVVITSRLSGVTVETIAIPDAISLWDISASSVSQAYGLSPSNKKGLS